MTTYDQTAYRPAIPTLLRWLRPPVVQHDEQRRTALRHGPTPRYEALAIGLGCDRVRFRRDRRSRGH